MADDELARLRERRIAELRTQVGTEARPASSPKGVVDVDDAGFADFVRSNQVALIDFWAPWCGPCHAMAPIVEATANRWAGRAAVGKVNTDENPATARALGIMSIPTTIVFRSGQPVAKLVGVQGGARLDAALAQAAGDRPERSRTRL